jgi:hypothetical protein
LISEERLRTVMDGARHVTGQGNSDMTLVRQPRWQRWVGYAAAGWSLGYGLLSLHWARGGAGFPFGRDSDPDADAVESILAGARASTAAPFLAGLALTSAPLALTMARSWGGETSSRSILAAAWGLAGTLLVVIPDRRLILLAAYAPVLLSRPLVHWQLAGSPHHPTGATLVFRDGHVPWPVTNQFLLLAGGLLWAGTAVAYADHDAAPAAWATPEAAARWGHWATVLAVAAPLPFAATRWAWALGVPLGISETFFREGQASGLWRIGSALATMTAAGAVLTLGLVRPWGETFPGWVVGLAGKPVPPALAIAPTTLVSIAVTSAGLGYVRAFLRSGIPEEGWAMAVPGLLWPLWGGALGAAALAYYYRRRASIPSHSLVSDRPGTGVLIGNAFSQ